MDSPPPFQEGVSQILMLNEELKQSLSTTSVEQWQMELETIVERLNFLFRLVLDAPGDDMKRDLYQHVHDKTKSTFMCILQHVSNQDVEEQAAVARMVELALVIQNNMCLQKEENEDYTNQVIGIYTSYQRFVLRNRSKPAIAYLAQWRQQDEATRHAAAIEEDDDEDEDENAPIARPHSHAIATILGQASALIHPLLLWKNGLPPEQASDLIGMCTETINVLDEQAQALTKTVSDWFWTDRNVDDWMSQVAAIDNNESVSTQKQVDLVELDALVEEMAFCSQLLARYQTLLRGTDTGTTLVEQELLPEWTWKYASLERFLARQQWKSALNLAHPVSIVMGLDIQVPSVVEDAQYLSSRALERAASTLSQQANGTVAHSISHDIWSTDIDGGVHQALMDQRGCWSEPESKKDETEGKSTPASTNSGSFASALLGALDEDLGGPSPASPPASKRSSAAPSSGSFLLGSLVGDGPQQQQIRLDMQLCQLNGIHSASVACTSLAESMENEANENDDAAKTSSMIQLAREELARYASSYKILLANQIVEEIHEYCGSLEDVDFEEKKCIHHLRHFFLSESYNLNEASFTVAEADERLESQLIVPLKESRLIMNLSKCDAEVTFLLCKVSPVFVPSFTCFGHDLLICSHLYRN